MEILSLKLLVPEDVVNRMLAERLPSDVTIEKLRVRITPDGIRILGEYPTPFMKVAFETMWSVAVANGLLVLRLSDVKVSGFPAAMLRGMLFSMLKESTAGEPGISVQNETLRIDIERFLLEKGLPLKTNLSGVICNVGSLLVEAGGEL